MDLASLATTLGLALLVAFACLLAFDRLGYTAGIGVILTAAIFAGGPIEVPLWRLRKRNSGPSGSRGACLCLGLNVGGCLVPLGVAIDRGLRLLPAAAWPLTVATGLVAVLSLLLARPIADRGIVLAWPLTGLLAAALGLTLGQASGSSATFAFIAGLVGPLIGAELPFWPALVRLGALRAGIGGGGPFDGLLWSSLLAALLGKAGS